MSKQAILNSVKASLRHNALHTESVSYENPLKSQDSDKVAEFIAMQRANKASVIESSPESLLADIRAALKECGAKKVLCNRDLDLELDSLSTGCDCTLLPYEKSVDSMRGELFNIDTALVQAVCGVANLGIIGVASSPLAPRLSSLITKTCIVLLKKSDIVEHFFSGVERLKARATGGKLPTNMVFIAGPSRTADIELQTVFGVHGSLATYVIVY